MLRTLTKKLGRELLAKEKYAIENIDYSWLYIVLYIYYLLLMGNQTANFDHFSVIRVQSWEIEAHLSTSKLVVNKETMERG